MGLWSQQDSICRLTPEGTAIVTRSGGVEQYIDTLVALLGYIRDNNVTLDDLARWMSDTFPNASGQIAVNGYISTVDFLKSDLIEALSATERGSLYTRVSPSTLTNKLRQI